MLANRDFEYVIASPPQFQYLVAEIYYDGMFVAQIIQERGLGLFDVETPGITLVESLVVRRVDAAGFVKAIMHACHLLSGN